jgi:hypothetical protein
MKSALKLLSTGLVVLLGSGCAMAPHPVEPYVNRTQEIDVADDTLVSIGNYELMESLTARLKKNDYGLEIADRIVFRDAAFPNGGWQLNELLTPENCARTISETGVTHMALIGPAAIEEEEIEGYYFPLVIGGMKADQKLTLAAVIYDLRSQDIVCRIESSAEGSSLVAIYIIIAVGTWPLTESAALNGLADEIALAISEDMNGEPTKIVLMGAESPTDDTPLTADVEAEEFFPFPGYDSTLTAGLSRDEIRARLGTPYLFSNKLQLDIFLSQYAIKSDLRTPYDMLGYPEVDLIIMAEYDRDGTSTSIAKHAGKDFAVQTDRYELDFRRRIEGSAYDSNRVMTTLVAPTIASMDSLATDVSPQQCLLVIHGMDEYPNLVHQGPDRKHWWGSTRLNWRLDNKSLLDWKPKYNMLGKPTGPRPRPNSDLGQLFVTFPLSKGLHELRLEWDMQMPDVVKFIECAGGEIFYVSTDIARPHDGWGLVPKEQAGDVHINATWSPTKPRRVLMHGGKWFDYEWHHSMP